LGLLPVVTTFAADKLTDQVEALPSGGRTFLGVAPPGGRLRGYEIHMGRTEFVGPMQPAFSIVQRSGEPVESVDGVVREFLTPKEGEFDSIAALGLRQDPAIRLPRVIGTAAKLWEEFDAHHIAGSERDKDETGELGEYVDGVPNHFLFANAYSRLAEIIGGRVVRQPFQGARVQIRKPARRGV
jgi:hypothetical protein